ncbi:DUF4150 domain-containing protein [Candidatus Methylospira mobilis]|uniref:DUF4150 domain-containing protein n=1 Tax=Candidatus Methylospira mobilis TaxID=1808979 RepID=A0A5Q0BCP2_9GAMM|nr:DUF4150 domain-containing protein [Candidatus Methylospira mobilis]QFY41580.1 DUF4150 domain-containing protein [Candidatus Methylospira mobilis]WNV05178.1 DUF4150 domain-containing protein [Candidatus Methylospira mobilis]
MFLLSSSGGKNLGGPDVCRTPTPAGPVPTPYPNISSCTAANPASTGRKMLLDMIPSVHQMTRILGSSGDEPGVLLGMMSNMIKGPTTFKVGAPKVLIQGFPAMRVTSVTAQNGMVGNCPGVSLVPTQRKVSAL